MSISSFYFLLAFSIFLSALFSGVEIAFLSANRLRLEIDRANRSLVNRCIQLYTKHPNHFISAMLVGNNVALVIYGMLMAKLLDPWLRSLSHSETFLLTAQTLISTIIILLIAEFLPKALCKAHPNAFLRILALPILIFYIIFYPISRATTWLSAKLIALVTHQKIDSAQQHINFGKTDLNDLVDEVAHNKRAQSQLDDEQHELKIFRNALEFSEVKLRECLVPRTDIEAADIKSSLAELRRIFIRTSFSRIPIYEDTIDNIVGYVNAKSLFRHPESIEEVLLPLPYVPGSMKAGSLLTRFIRDSLSIAIVVDEFGGTDGLVTIEDLLEEIFGEINDEHDKINLTIKQIAEHEFLFSGRAEVAYLNELFDLGISETESYDTVAGFILHHHPDIPQQNELITIGNFQFRILRVDTSRIVLVHLTVLE